MTRLAVKMGHMLTYRPTTPDDQVALLKLLHVVWQGDEGAVAYHGRGRSAGQVALHGGQVVGYAHLGRDSLHKTHTYCGVYVLPEFRGQGIGSRLWELAVAGRAASLKTATYADLGVQALGFLARRGLRVSLETHMPLLSPADLSAEQVEGWVQEATALGFELLPMTALTGTDLRRRLTRLHLDVYAHTHKHDPPEPESEEEAESDFLGADLVPDWLYVAQQGGVLAGVSSVRRDTPLDMLGWFGVTKPFARVGPPLTLALTALAIQAAGQGGVQQLTAELDSADPNALHLLNSLPWKPDRVWLTLTSAG